jgi:hypothetical protein
VLGRAAEADGLTAFRVLLDRVPDVNTARLLVADGQTILLSTRTAGQTTDIDHNTESDGTGAEVAFWTSETAFASVLAELAETWLNEPFE